MAAYLAYRAWARKRALATPSCFHPAPALAPARNQHSHRFPNPIQFHEVLPDVPRIGHFGLSRKPRCAIDLDRRHRQVRRASFRADLEADGPGRALRDDREAIEEGAAEEVGALAAVG